MDAHSLNRQSEIIPDRTVAMAQIGSIRSRRPLQRAVPTFPMEVPLIA